MTTKNTNLQENDLKYTKKTKILAASIALIVLLSIIGGILIFNQPKVESRSEEKKEEVKAQITPTSTPTALATIEPIQTPAPTATTTIQATPTSTPLPTATPKPIKYFRYTDRETGLSFDYSEDMRISIKQEFRDTYNRELAFRVYEIKKGKSVLTLALSQMGADCPADPSKLVRVDRIIPSSKVSKFYFARTKSGTTYKYGEYSSSRNGQGYFTECNSAEHSSIGSRRLSYLTAELKLGSTSDLAFYDGLMASLNL